MLVIQLCLTLCDPVDCRLLLCPWDSPGKSTGAGCHSLLQGIFLTQGSNLGHLHCRWTLHCLSYQGSPLRLGTAGDIVKGPGFECCPLPLVRGVTSESELLSRSCICKVEMVPPPGVTKRNK